MWPSRNWASCMGESMLYLIRGFVVVDELWKYLGC